MTTLPLPPQWLKFALCDDCVGFRERRHGTRDKGLLKQIQKEEHAHRNFVRAQRTGYMTRRHLAEVALTRARYFSLILDGADQYAYGLPYFWNVTHSTMGAWKVKTHLMGGIAHGRQVYGYVYLDNFTHGMHYYHCY